MKHALRLSYRSIHASLAAAFALSLALTACGGDNNGSGTGNGNGSTGGNPTTDGGTSTDAAPVYALVSYVIGPEGTNTYVNLMGSLDVSTVDVTQGREFPGSAGAGVVGGKLFVSSGDSPTTTRFDVRGAAWTEESTISFGHYGSTAPLFINGFVSPTKAYMAVNVAQRAIWDPSTMSITGSKGAPASLPLNRADLKVGAGYDRSISVRGDRMFWPFNWHDDAYQAFSPVSQIAIYDTKTDENVGLVDLPCPDIDYASQAEDGTVYFSSWGFGVTAPTFDTSAAKTCIARIKAGEETLDSSFTFSVSSLTEGREGMGFHYLKDGKGFLSVFYKERLTADTDPKAAIYTANWRIWIVDLNAHTAALVESIPFFAGAASNTFTVDDRVFVLFPTAADYSTSAAYEVLPDGTAVKRFESKGWAAQLFRVR